LRYSPRLILGDEPAHHAPVPTFASARITPVLGWAGHSVQRDDPHLERLTSFFL
jgi:hypothetical protein